MSKVASTIYTGAASIGEAKATIYGVVGGIVAVVLSISAIFSIMSTPTRSSETQAIVVGTGSTCSQITQKMGDGQTKVYPECITKIEYTINGQLYNAQVNTQSQKLNVGDKITIKYDPRNPIDVSYNEIPLSTLGWFLLIGVIILVLFILGYNFIIRRYKPLAAYEGATTSIDLAKGFTRRLFD